MSVRKTAAVAGLATGAAIAFAPLASAVPTDLIDFDSINSSEIASLNSLFTLGAQFTGVPDTAYAEAGPGGFLALTPAGITEFAPHLTDASQVGDVTAFEYYLYGVNPIEAGISSGSGAYNVFNGAAIQFTDAYNAELYSLINPGDTAPADIFLGSDANVAAALATDNPAIYFYNFAIGDLGGYFQQDLSALQIPVADAVPGAADATSTIDLSPTFAAEIEGLNSLFASDVAAAGIDSSKIVDGMGSFDTIAPGDTNDIFNTLVFGFNPDNISTDPGSYDVFNGALTEFANAYNVGLFSLLDPTSTFDPADIFGTHADLLAGGATSAISEFLQLGVSDLAGYFDFGSFAGM
jgi:hypothetical protein